MSYYKPKYLSVVTFFAAMVNSLSFPVLGLVSAKVLIYSYKTYRINPNFTK